MLEISLEMMKETTVFLMIGKIILNLGVGNQYEKYTKLVISFMAVLQLWSGMRTAFSTISIEGVIKEKQQFYQDWKEETRKFEEQLYEQQSEIEERWMTEDEEGKELQTEQEIESGEPDIKAERKIEIESIRIP